MRPLYDDNADNPSAVTRDYIFELDADGGEAPLLSVFGGKITTFRKLSEHALDKIASFLPRRWTGLDGEARTCPAATFRRRISTSSSATCAAHTPGCRPSLAKHYARLYGTRARDLVGARDSRSPISAAASARISTSARRSSCSSTEWAVTAEDILERRTKHGLHMTAAEEAAFEDWCSGRLAKAG